MKTIAGSILVATLILLLSPTAHAKFVVCNQTTWTIKFIWYKGHPTQGACPNNLLIDAWYTIPQRTCRTLDNSSMNSWSVGWWATVSGGSSGLPAGTPLGWSKGSPGPNSGEQWYPTKYDFFSCYDGNLFGSQSLCKVNWPADAACRQLVGSKWQKYNTVDVTANIR